jgi:hypothetical protein
MILHFLRCPRFRTHYTFLTIGLVVLSAALFAASIDGSMMGLAERISAFVGFHWTFTLAYWMFSRESIAG